MSEEVQDPRPAGCENDSPCPKRGSRCSGCKGLAAWYARNWRRRNPESAKAYDRARREKPGHKEWQTEHNRTYAQTHRAQIRAHRSAVYWADPDAARARARRYYYKTKYGLTPQERDAILEGTCPICLKRPCTHIDHDHKTGLVRGGLCMTCNTHVGWLEDVGLAAVKRYLDTK